MVLSVYIPHIRFYLLNVCTILHYYIVDKKRPTLWVKYGREKILKLLNKNVECRLKDFHVNVDFAQILV